MGKVNKFLKDPYYVIGRFLMKNYPKLMSDKFFIKVLWRQSIGTKLNLDNPTTFNEKLQWLKLNNRDALLINLVDKKTAKEWVADRIGKEYVIRTLGVYDSVDEINLDALPGQFVLKCNHDCGSVVVCRNKSDFDIESAKKKLNDSLKKNYYWDSREWPYKRIRRCVIAEEFLTDGNASELCDYKVHCFNGVPKLVLVCKDRHSETGLTEDFFTEEWEHLELKRPAHPISKETIQKPEQLEEMLSLSRKLSKDFPFVRVDWYICNDKLYFGELTFFPASGMSPFVPDSYDNLFGSWLELPERK